ncbi:MAG: hypothetical protein ABI210_15325, partial [Abditibacteriaceae bacterium]
MKKFQPLFLLLLLARIACAALSAPATPTKAPFPYVWATAHHILPQTTSDEAGYFSIIQGHNGRIYIGTAKDDADAYLVEFDPQTNQQRIVIDTNKVNGLTATGYAAQAKIHTRNFVGASGKIYCGSQEGYRDIPGDKSVYQGGFVMTYDPTTEKAESLGMPMKGEGIIDVVADEARNSLYVVTTLGEDKVAHWLVGNIKTKSYHELGPLPTDYASTLLDNKGRANVMTADSRIATYDPQTGKIAVRDIMLNGKKWVRNNDSAVPTWQLTPDKNGAYLVLMNEATLFHLDLRGNGSVKAKVLCQLIGGKGFDSRSSLTVAPDGRVYALIKTDNETGFGNFPLQHLTRYDPTTERAVDLGVLAVKNPTFYDFSPDKQRPNAAPYTYHGYDKLPDGTLAPTTVNQGLVAAKDGTMYALILYPYTLLKMESAAPAGEGFEPQRTNVLDHAQIPVLNSKGLAAALVTPKLASPSQQYIDFSLRSCDNVEKNLPQITRIAEIVADRHIKGGLLGFPWNSQSLQQEIAGRAGGLMN